MKAVVTGMIVTSPLGGVAWDYGQYALGLERLGFEVYYLEDTGLPTYSLDEATGEYLEDCSYGVSFLQQSLTQLSQTLGKRWHYRGYDDSVHGLTAGEIAEVVATADVLINVSGGTMLRDSYQHCPRKVLIDTDPGWNHFVVFPRWETFEAEHRRMGFRSHDHFFTYASRLGATDCRLPSFGLPWRQTRPPVVIDRWKAEPPGENWTTVMSWKTYGTPIESDGVVYGAKEKEFHHIESLPQHANATFEVAVSGQAPVQRWQDHGWSVVNAHPKSCDMSAYQAYVQGSRGECSVAKNVYVGTRSGWFSCRTACYLAAGRPAVVQETGFSEVIPTGEGLLAFRTGEEASAAVTAVERDYARHQQAARALAEEEFGSATVLTDLLSQIGMR